MVCVQETVKALAVGPGVIYLFDHQTRSFRAIELSLYVFRGSWMGFLQSPPEIGERVPARVQFQIRRRQLEAAKVRAISQYFDYRGLLSPNPPKADGPTFLPGCLLNG